MRFTATTHVVAAGVPIAVLAAVLSTARVATEPPQAALAVQPLTIRQDEGAGTIAIYRAGERQPVVVQNAAPDQRPYLHPIAAPDGRGVVTEDRPSHHPHQTGLYWGFTRLNGRDYFHNPGAGYWRRVSATVTRGEAERGSDEVRWQTVYDLLDAAGQAVLTETQRWSMRERGGRLFLDLEWRGEPRADATIGQYDYGGLFLRMPWREGIAGEVVNAARQRNERAEGQRAMWIDVGMRVDGRSDFAHVAIFDHPDNTGYPQPWRVDAQLGVGSARSRSGDLTLRAGQTEIIRHQFVVHTGILDDVEVTRLWAEFAGNRSLAPTSALWGIAQREGREAPLLSPDEAVAQMTVMPGYAVNAWAAEPMIQQPMAFAWDDRGRLWVAENRDYETRRQGFSNGGDSRIVILEDTDRDGAADSRKVFLEGIVFPSALAIGLDGVFVGAPPNLLFVPDRNRDDRADVDDIEVRLTGWGIQDRHEVINSLHWGPDGWLYGLQGYATSSKVRRPADGGRLYRRGDPFPDVMAGDGVEINGGVWRYHPTKDVFEVVAHGFSNPWGIDYDAQGQLLISACVIPHLWHVVPGGIFQRQGGRHFNPYVYSDIQTIADHRHRSAHGGARVYQSDAFPESQRGRIFMANIHEHAILSDVLVRRGSSFTAHHGDDLLLANNAHWIGFSVEIGPDGFIYVLDWHDSDICGNAVDHGETGRIFRIAAVPSRAAHWEGRYADLGAMSDAALVELQTSVSDWHARRARVILQGRAAKGALAAGTHDALRRLFATHRSPDVRLRAMWALHVTGGWTAAGLVDALRHRDEHVRAWAVQLLTEDRAAPPDAVARFAKMAQDDESPVVRLYLASALQRLEPGARWAVAANLLRHEEDARDHNLPTMVWLGIEPLVAGDPVQALERAAVSRIPQVARFIARRSVDAQALDAVVAAIEREPRTLASLLEGLRDGLTGRYDVSAPAAWPRVFERLQRSNTPVAALARDVAQQFGDAETATRNLSTIQDAGQPIDSRRRALQVLAAQQRPQLAAELAPLFEVSELRVDVIRAIAAYDQDALGRLLVDRYQTLGAAEQAEAIQTLASRARYGRMLTDALASGVVPRRDVPTHLARQLRRLVGVRFAEVWGPVDANTAADRTIARYRSLLADMAAGAPPAGISLAGGGALFRQTCGACHRLFGEGGDVGPDLTGSNRHNLEYLLFNVLDPNGDVPDAYRMTVVTTRDGRTFSGAVIAETDRQITLRQAGQTDAVVNLADIQSRDTTTQSLMPSGLFDALTDAEVRNLVAYLQRPEPVP
jgi:putative membrane-bound dehydrogenase-like protein